MGQENIFTYHFISLWLFGIVYSTSILYKKSSLKIHTKIICRVWEPLNKRGWPHGKGEAIAPGVGGGGHPGELGPLLGTARVTQECQQKKLGVSCQTSSITTLPTTGPRRDEQRNLLKEALPLPTCREKSISVGRLLWEGSETLPPAPYTYLGLGTFLPGGQNFLKSPERGLGSYCTDQSLHSPKSLVTFQKRGDAPSIPPHVFLSVSCMCGCGSETGEQTQDSPASREDPGS